MSFSSLFVNYIDGDFMETTEYNELGSIHISQKVISTIAAVTALSASSVVSLGANLKETAAAKIGRAGSDKGVDTSITDDNQVEITVRLIVRHGCRIPDLALQVQKSIRDAVELLTGCHVQAVHIVVQNIEFSKDKVET